MNSVSIDWTWVANLLYATIRMAVPLVFISIAELYGQKAGMVNIGLEGLATIGALAGFLVSYKTGNNWLGILCGAAAGAIINMIYAYATVSLCADHTVYGMAINIFAPALASFIYKIVFGAGSELSQIQLMKGVSIGFLQKIPFIGDFLYNLLNQPVMVYIAILLVIVTNIFFNKTKAGLNYKAVGEHPHAAATLGINVIKIKYISCIICGALCGVGGAYLHTCYATTYSEGSIAGRGFIALAAVIFGRWTSNGILGACLFFGFCDALQIRLQVASIGIPYQFFQMIPYIATIVVLAVLGAKKGGPMACGKPYRRESR